MTNFFLLIKKYKVPIALLSLSLVIFAIAFFVPQRGIAPKPTPASTPQPTVPAVPKGEWGSLDTLTRNLGKPVDAEDTATKSGEYRYKSTSVNRDHEVTYQSNVPIFYKQIVTTKDNQTAKSIKQKYGNAEIRLYGPESDINFYLYAYPSKGIAYIGSIYDDIITEVWYFSPTDLNNFMSTWAKDYSLQPQDGIF